MKRERPGMMHLKKVTNTADYDSYGLPGAARPRPQLAAAGRRRPGRSPSRRPPTGVCGAPAPAPGRESHNAQLGLGRPWRERPEGRPGAAAAQAPAGSSPGPSGEAAGRRGGSGPAPRRPGLPPRARSPRGGAAAPPGGRSGVARGGHVPGKAPAERCPGRRAGGGPPSALGGAAWPRARSPTTSRLLRAAAPAPGKKGPGVVAQSRPAGVAESEPPRAPTHKPPRSRGLQGCPEPSSRNSVPCSHTHRYTHENFCWLPPHPPPEGKFWVFRAEPSRSDPKLKHIC